MAEDQQPSQWELMRRLDTLATAMTEGLARIETRLGTMLTVDVFQAYQEGTRRELTELHKDVADVQAQVAKDRSELDAASKERNTQVNTRIDKLEAKQDQNERDLKGVKNMRIQLIIGGVITVAAALVISVLSRGLGLP